MNIKNSKKILSTTVFAAIIVLLAFSVMSTTANTQDNKLVTMFGSEKGNLGDVVDVTIDVTNVGNVGDEKVQTVKVVDTLPAGLTYIRGTFRVNGKEAVHTVDEQVISCNIGQGTYNIKFDVKVTKDYWEDRNVKNVVVGTWYGDNGKELERITDTAEFNIVAQDNELATYFDSSEGNLGDVRKVTIEVTNVNEVTPRVNVVDRLPAEFTYIAETFTVNGRAAKPNVKEQVISYNIINPDVETTYTIEFNVKVTKAYWENRNVKNVVVGTWYDDKGNVLGTIRVTPEPEFNIVAFTGLHEDLIKGSMKPVIGTPEAWEITMYVENNIVGNNIVGYTMEDPKITEGFGGDLWIDFIKVGATTCTFDNYEKYGTKNDATVDICCKKDDVIMWKENVKLDKRGVTQGGVHIYWTGMTHKAHFVWDNIGDLEIGDKTGIITFGVSTDTNPQGKQEYTSLGPHTLNSGARLTFNDKDRMELSAVAAPIEVTAVP